MAHRRHLPDLPPLLRRRVGRRHRRSRGRHRRTSTTSKRLGVDAIWLSPFQRSPQKDAGYDVSRLLRRRPALRHAGRLRRDAREAHDRGIRVIVDLVPEPLLRPARVVPAGARRRARQPPSAPATSSATDRARTASSRRTTGSRSSAAPPGRASSNADGTPGQWYLHLFDSSQPDFDWANAEVQEEFRRVLRFWLDRGVDGFRVDVAHGLVKAEGLPDYTPDPDAGSMGGDEARCPYWGQDAVHDIYRDWRAFRGVPRPPHASRRGVDAVGPADSSLGTPRRAAPGVQLRVPRNEVGCCRPPRDSSRSRRAHPPHRDVLGWDTLRQYTLARCGDVRYRG